MSRNAVMIEAFEKNPEVTPREGRVSRNDLKRANKAVLFVTPREGRVSRNVKRQRCRMSTAPSRPARGV